MHATSWGQEPRPNRQACRVSPDILPTARLCAPPAVPCFDVQVGEEPEDTVGLKRSGGGGKFFKGRRPQQQQQRQRRDGGRGVGGGTGDEGGGLRKRGGAGPKMTVRVKGGGDKGRVEKSGKAGKGGIGRRK